MNITSWLTVLTICALGAMSPGPSLAVVLRHTLSGGRRHGCIAALTHGLGIALYGFATVSGLAFVITASPELFRVFKWAGAGYLIWLGIKGVMASTKPQSAASTKPTAAAGAARDGFLIVFLNPKIAVFFIALFSQVIGPDTSLPVRGVYVATVWFTDTAWYLIVAWFFSNPRWLASLQAKTIWFERVFGIILLALAARLILESMT